MTDAAADLAVTLTAIADWYRLARHEEEWAVYETGRGDPAQAAVHRRRAKLYNDTARALRLELETGEPHCTCHLRTAAERKVWDIRC